MTQKMPENDRNYCWTMHSKAKLFQYNLSASAIKRVIRYPDRVQAGVAPETTAVMRKKSAKDEKKGEIWVMFQKSGHKKRIISAWIYPGVSPEDKEIHIPEEVLRQLEQLNLTEKG